MFRIGDKGLFRFLCVLLIERVNIERKIGLRAQVVYSKLLN